MNKCKISLHESSSLKSRTNLKSINWVSNFELLYRVHKQERYSASLYMCALSMQHPCEQQFSSCSNKIKLKLGQSAHNVFDSRPLNMNIIFSPSAATIKLNYFTEYQKQHEKASFTSKMCPSWKSWAVFWLLWKPENKFSTLLCSAKNGTLIWS